MQVQKKAESKLLDRAYVEFAMDGKAGKVTRKEAVALLAKEMGVPEENVGLVSLDGQSGTRAIVGRFYVYGSKESKKRTHPKYLDIRALSKEEKEKLKQEKKKPAAAAEAKK